MCVCVWVGLAPQGTSRQANGDQICCVKPKGEGEQNCMFTVESAGLGEAVLPDFV